MRLLLQSVVFAVLVLAACAKLRVMSPHCTTKEATDATVGNEKTCEQVGGVTLASELSIRDALFGIPQYSGAITGMVFYATPDDRDGCMPLNLTHLGANYENAVEHQIPIIMMVDRGACMRPAVYYTYVVV